MDISLNYRAEIDGLRALSVIAVLLFHAELGVPGGYVGVDVFFVISGFLITGIIVTEIEKGTFSFLQFWARRIRRILPAATAVIASSILIGAIILDPQALVGLGKSALAFSLLSSNLFFWTDSGYFAESALSKPLLHTWSLSVEEQFYVALPLLLVGMTRIGARGRVFSLLGALTVASFLIGVYGTFRHPSAAFYLLPSRAWEMLAGSMLSLMPRDAIVSRLKSEVFSCLGILMIVGPMFVFDSHTLFPGVAALLPVIGACSVIYGTRRVGTLVGRALSVKPLVCIGLISYSLYLWHWPLLTFARVALSEFGLQQRLVIIALVVVLSILTWKYVELPFRHGFKSLPVRKVIRGGFFATLTVVLASLAVMVSKGFPGRVGRQYQEMLTDVVWRGEEYASNGGKWRGIGKESSSSGKKPAFAIWGDSHGMVAAHALDVLGKEIGVDGLSFCSSGQPPVPGLWRPYADRDGIMAATADNEKVLKYIIKEKIPNVIIVGRWASMCNGRNQSELAEDPHSDFRLPMVSDDRYSGTIDASVACGALRNTLVKTIDELTKNGITVWIVKQVPEADNCQIARRFYYASRFPVLNEMDRVSSSRALHEKRQHDANGVLDSIGFNPRIKRLDPSDQFFRDGQLIVSGERAYYRDDDHLTRFGVLTFLVPFFRPHMEHISKQ